MRATQIQLLSVAPVVSYIPGEYADCLDLSRASTSMLKGVVAPRGQSCSCVRRVGVPAAPRCWGLFQAGLFLLLSFCSFPSVFPCCWPSIKVP